MKEQILRLPAEQLFQKEIDALIAAEHDPIPTGWKMSPRSVRTYICGGKVGKTVITPKYIGHERLVEIAIATLVTDRALLLIGEPGTAKSWLSEHLTAAINGNSTKVIQGTARRTDSLFMELCYADCTRTVSGSNAQKSCISCNGNRYNRQNGRDFKMCFRGSGRIDFDFIRKENFSTRA